MLPLILVAVGAYLIGDSVLEDKKLAKGGKTQGYDDKEDERLAMEHGKMSKKDLDSTHARRDDARFEERGKMEHGGEMAKGGKVMTDKQTIAKLKKQFDKKYQGNDFDFDKDDNFKVDGYNVEVFDYKEEDEMKDYIVKNSKDNYLVPYSSDDDNYYLIVVPKDKMAKDGKLVGKQKNLDVNKNGKLDAEDFKMLRKGKKMAKGGKLKINGDDFSFLLDLTDKELSKRLDLTRKQQDINGKQYLAAKEKNQSTKKFEDSRKNLDNQERAIIEARARKMAK